MNYKTVTIGGVQLDVSYTATEYRAATLLDPEEPVEIEIESVECNGTDIYHLLSDSANTDIKKAIELSGEGDGQDPQDFWDRKQGIL